MDWKKEAQEFAIHYFRLIAKEAGVNWHADNDREIQDLIDMIIRAAVQEAKLERR